MKESKIKRKREKWTIGLLNRNMEEKMRCSGAGGQKHRSYSGNKNRKARERRVEGQGEGEGVSLLGRW